MAIDSEDFRVKKERSPSFPFISLPRALERLQAFYDAHRREPTRVNLVALTWNYSPTSSGHAQTIAALKQYGLLEEVKGGEDRKLQITDLGRKIVADQRPGAREQGILEAAQRPRLLAEYLQIWVPDRPNDAHRMSDLEIDRGFNQAAARQFIRVFDETVSFAGLNGRENPADSSDGSDAVEPVAEDALGAVSTSHPSPQPSANGYVGDRPLSERLQVVTTGKQLTVSAALVSAREVDKLIRILQANKVLLEDEDDERADGDQLPNPAEA